MKSKSSVSWLFQEFHELYPKFNFHHDGIIFMILRGGSDGTYVVRCNAT